MVDLRLRSSDKRRKRLKRPSRLNSKQYNKFSVLAIIVAMLCSFTIFELFGMLFLHRITTLRRNYNIDPSKAKVLYLDTKLPNPSKGGGFGRSFDNLSIIAELGYGIVVASYAKTSEDWCDWYCRDDMQKLGVEVYEGPWEKLVEDRVEFFEVVIISRPTTFQLTHSVFRAMFAKSPFAVVYDSEALWYRRDEDLVRLYRAGTHFPSMVEEGSPTADELELITSSDKSNEVKLLGMADVVVTVSQNEATIASQLSPKASIETIGHVMNLDNHWQSKSGFRERSGILFIASFDDRMYYNGDAIWYFLEETYPSIIERSPGMKLTIAGRKIPQYLRTYSTENRLDQSVTFLESPESLKPLYESHRIFIAPHLYGSGIQFKLSEALSFGIPCVMSKLSADAFGITRDSEIACIGENVESFISCVVSLHENEQQWSTVRENGKKFIAATHSRHRVLGVWSGVVEEAKRRYKEMKREFESKEVSHSPLFSTDLWVPTQLCPEGEVLYRKQYPDVRGALDKKVFESAFQHWRDFGQGEGRSYVCYRRR